MIEITSEIYSAVAARLTDAIEASDFFNGTIEFETDEFYSVLTLTAIVRRRSETLPEHSDPSGSPGPSRASGLSGLSGLSGSGGYSATTRASGSSWSCGSFGHPCHSRRPIADVVPVWWEFSTVQADGEVLNDFSFSLLRPLLIQTQ